MVMKVIFDMGPKGKERVLKIKNYVRIFLTEEQQVQKH